MSTKIKTISFFIFILFVTIIVDSKSIFAQSEEDVPIATKYMRDKYEEYYEASFDIVFNAVKQFVTESGAEIEQEATADNDLGFKKGMVRSKILVLTQKTDSAFTVIQKYSFKPPFIRGGVWTSVRIQYRILLNDEGNGKISVVFNNEFSGFEENISYKVHFFKTNGLLEHEGFEKIKELIASKK